MTFIFMSGSEGALAPSLPGQVLIAYLDSADRRALGNMLTGVGLEPVFSTTLEEAEAFLSHLPISMVFCEDCLPGGGFRSVLEQMARTGTEIPVIVVSRLDDWDVYLKAMRAGAFDYITPPFSRAGIVRVVNNALREYSRLHSYVPAEACT